LLNKAGLDLSQSPVSAKALGDLIKMVEDETISGKMAKTVFEEMFESRKSPLEIVESKGLKQITNDQEILDVVKREFDANPGQLAEFLGGNQRLLGFFVGQVMKATSGAANPKKVNELINKEAQIRLSKR